MSCPVNRDTVSNGIQAYAAEALHDSLLFTEKDELFYVKDELSDYQSVVDEINTSFKEDVVMQFNNQPIFAVVEPSDNLIDKYFPQQEVEPQGDVLDDKQQMHFDTLTKTGVLGDVVSANGKVYYTVNDVDAVNEYILQNNIDFINVIEGDTAPLVELGYKEKISSLNPEQPAITPTTQSSKAGAVTKRKVLQFLENIGFRDVQEVQSIVYKGKVVDANAIIDFGKGVMQIQAGEEDVSLTEESMHILTKLVQQSRPELYEQMRKEIVNYQLYRDVLADPAYTNNSEYLTESGGLDYEKIKEEAISKLLAEFLVNKLEETQESTQKIAKVYNFWSAILTWIQDIFGGHNNPFQSVIDEIQDNDVAFGIAEDIESDDVFYSMKSKTQRDAENQVNRPTFDAIDKRPGEEKIYKQDSAYYKEGKKVDDTRRVTQKVSDFYKKLFGNKNFDDSLQAFYDQSRDDGTYIHELFDNILNSYIDKDTGLLKTKATPLTFPLNTPLQKETAKKIDNFVRGTLAQYKEGTRFVIEQIIYDKEKDVYGTIDFLAIKPDGEVDILDWKSLLLPTMESVKDYKKDGFNIQLNEYKRILKESYGVEKFGKIRAIPIKKTYKKQKDDSMLLTGIEIGDSHASKITNDKKYLRPIISSEESTGSEQKDELVTKLTALYQKYIEKGYFKDDRTILTDVEDAIYEIRVSNNIKSLTSYYVDLVAKFDDLVKSKGELLKTMDKTEIQNALVDISFFEDILEFVVEPSEFLQEDVNVNKDDRTQLFNEASKLRYFSDKLKKMRESLVDSLAEKQGIHGLLKPEKVVSLAARYMRSMGSQNMATVKYMYELVKKAYNKITLRTNEQQEELRVMKLDFDKWIKEKGISAKDAIGKIVNYEKGSLYSKIDKKFYEQRALALESKDALEIKKFIADNYDTTEYTAWYTTALAENKKNWSAQTYNSNPKINAKIIKGKIETFEKMYDIKKHPITAFSRDNPKVFSRNIKIEKWLSPEFQELQKPENAPLLKMYDYMVQKNLELAETGAIDEWEAYTFMPNVRKSFADVMSFENKGALSKVGDSLVNSYEDWKNSISVDDYELNYQGQRDPFTGEPLQKRYIPFVSDLSNSAETRLQAAMNLNIFKKDDKSILDKDGKIDRTLAFKKIEDYRAASPANAKKFADEMTNLSQKSFDIFTVYGLMVKEINKEKYLKDNDEILRALVHIEKGKKTFVQNKFGALNMKTGKPEVSNETGKNARILEEHVKAVVNGEQIQHDADLIIRFKLREKWNNTPLGKLYQFKIDDEYKPTAISATKFIMWLNRANQKRILGVNAASAISNLFGGVSSSNKIYSKYVDAADIQKGWTKMTSAGFYQSEDMKKNAALVDYFLPLLDNREGFKSSQMSVNDAAKVLSQEWLMYPMRKTSEIVQLNIFFGVLENTGFVNGKVVNLREMLAQEIGYHNRFSLSETEREAKEKEFQTKLKAYKDKHSLVKHAQFKTIKENGKDKVIIDLPGVDRFSEEIEKIRDIVQTISKDALGEADEFDVANYKYSIWWRLMMTFKNWIPRTADVRFGEFRHDQAHNAYEYGRVRMFARALGANYIHTFTKLIPLPYITGKVTNSIFGKQSLIDKAIEVYEIKKQKAKDLGTFNEKTFISQDEFVEKFIHGTEATFAEVRTLILMSTLLFVGFAAPDDDDSQEEKAFKALLRKQIDKLSDEVGFFYSPKSGIDIAGGAAPVTGLVKDGYGLMDSVFKQFLGFGMEGIGFDEKGITMQENAKPIKRTFKMFPVLKEVLTYLPAVDKDLAKEWGVRINDRRGF